MDKFILYARMNLMFLVVAGLAQLIAEVSDYGYYWSGVAILFVAIFLSEVSNGVWKEFITEVENKINEEDEEVN